MNVEIGDEAALFPEKEYISGIFVAVQRVPNTGLLNEYSDWTLDSGDRTLVLSISKVREHDTDHIHRLNGTNNLFIVNEHAP